MGAKGAGYPFNHTAFLHYSAFGVQVVHVFGPVLNGGIAEPGFFAHIQLHAAGMQIGHIVFGRGTAFDKMQIGALIHNDERVFKLSRSRRVSRK